MRFQSNTTYSDVCKDLIDNKSIREIFDYILVDEAQDFPLDFFLLVEKVLKQLKKVVIAYDELQTTNDIKIPDFSVLFGSTNGKANIELDENHDYILRKSCAICVCVYNQLIAFINDNFSHTSAVKYLPLPVNVVILFYFHQA